MIFVSNIDYVVFVGNGLRWIGAIIELRFAEMCVLQLIPQQLQENLKQR